MKLPAGAPSILAALLLLAGCASDATKAREALAAGKQLASRRSLDEAADRFAEAARLDPQLHEASARLARTRLEQDRAGDAATAARQAASLVPRSAYYAELLGRSQLSGGATVDALASFERAITLDPAQTARLACSIGAIYEHEGKPVDAQRSYERAIAADADAASPRRALARLRAAQRSGEGASEGYGTLMGDLVGDSPGFAAVDIRGVGDLGFTGTGRSGGSGEGTIGMGGITAIGFGPLGHGGGQPTLTSSATLGSATVVGSLSGAVVRRVVRRHLNEIRYCYEQALARNRTLHGTVSLTLVIDATGAVSESAATGLGDVAVESCMAEGSRRWAFPTPDDGAVVRVTQPIELSEPVAIPLDSTH